MLYRAFAFIFAFGVSVAQAQPAEQQCGKIETSAKLEQLFSLTSSRRTSEAQEGAFVCAWELSSPSAPVGSVALIVNVMVFTNRQVALSTIKVNDSKTTLLPNLRGARWYWPMGAETTHHALVIKVDTGSTIFLVAANAIERPVTNAELGDLTELAKRVSSGE